MGPRYAVIAAVVLLVAAGGVADASLAVTDDGPVRQTGGDGGPGDGGDGGMADGGDGGPGDGGDGGPDGGPGDGAPRGPANVSVRHSGPGNASVQVRNAAADQTIRVRFERMVGSPDAGIRVREMAMRTTDADGNFSLAVRTQTRASAGVDEFPHGPAFGYLNVTHTVPNANVTNASLTFTMERTRLRERNVTTDDVSLYRFRATNRTWQRLETRIVAQNQSQVTYRAESPGLSEFAVAQTVADAEPTPTATEAPDRTETGTPTEGPEATPTPTAEPTPTATEGGGAGFGPLVALLALVAGGLLARRR
jgi:PGF-pre-PGF domain-containing protein/PGF-CTERM protein